MGRTLKSLPFQFTAGLAFFEKADAEPGKERRIAGVISTESEDQEGERVLQDGLDFGYFLTKGYFNEHHAKGISGIVGYPERVERFKKGEHLPDGSAAKSNCTWAEGCLLKGDERADAIWAKGLALQGTPRALGFSVEGKALAKANTAAGQLVTKAIVRHCAITHMPVNADTRMRTLVKALLAVERAPARRVHRAWAAFEKALTDAPRPATPVQPRTNLSYAEAVELVRARHPVITDTTARRLVDAIAARRRRAA